MNTTSYPSMPFLLLLQGGTRLWVVHLHRTPRLLVVCHQGRHSYKSLGERWQRARRPSPVPASQPHGQFWLPRNSNQHIGRFFHCPIVWPWAHAARLMPQSRVNANNSCFISLRFSVYRYTTKVALSTHTAMTRFTEKSTSITASHTSAGHTLFPPHLAVSIIKSIFTPNNDIH